MFKRTWIQNTQNCTVGRFSFYVCFFFFFLALALRPKNLKRIECKRHPGGDLPAPIGPNVLQVWRKHTQAHIQAHKQTQTVLQGNIKKDTKEWWDILFVISFCKIILHHSHSFYGNLKVLSRYVLSSFVFLSKVHGCRCCFSLATLGEAIPLCRWLTGGGCGCVYCFKCLCFSPLRGNKDGKSCPPNTDLRSGPSSADWSLCFLEGCCDRSV